MTPDETPRPDPDGPPGPDEVVSPEEEARVRSLLASVDAPAMPPDVAARLQHTIRAEAQARATASAPSPGVTPIGAARSRRRLVPLLAAAAVAVGVLAVGVPVALNQSEDRSGATSEAEDGAEAPQPSPSEAAPEPSSGAGKPRNDAVAPSGRLPSLTTAGFADDVRRLTGGERQPRRLDSRPTDLECAGGRLVGPGAIEVTLDDSPASLISYGPDDARVFEAIGCGTGTPTSLAKATLDLR